MKNSDCCEFVSVCLYVGRACSPLLHDGKQKSDDDDACEVKCAPEKQKGTEDESLHVQLIILVRVLFLFFCKGACDDVRLSYFS